MGVPLLMLEFQEIVLNIFTISFGNCMHQIFMQIEDYLFHRD